MKEYHTEGFLIGYISEHIKIYKRLENIKNKGSVSLLRDNYNKK